MPETETRIAPTVTIPNSDNKANATDVRPLPISSAIGTARGS